jgi:Flp pilus assembly protein TadB
MSDYSKAALRTLYALICIALGVAVFQVVTEFPLVGMILGMIACLGLLYWMNLRDVRYDRELQELNQSLEQKRDQYKSGIREIG